MQRVMQKTIFEEQMGRHRLRHLNYIRRDGLQCMIA